MVLCPLFAAVINSVFLNTKRFLISFSEIVRFWPFLQKHRTDSCKSRFQFFLSFSVRSENSAPSSTALLSVGILSPCEGEKTKNQKGRKAGGKAAMKQPLKPGRRGEK